MSELLFGKALNWTCWDHRNVLTALLDATLKNWSAEQNIKSRLTRVEHLEDQLQALSVHPIGLSAWALWDEESLETLCHTLLAVREMPRPPLRVCYLAPELAEYVAILSEAGAQIVFSQLPSLEAVLSKALSEVTLSQHGFHPLTGGLLERLPWGE